MVTQAFPELTDLSAFHCAHGRIAPQVQALLTPTHLLEGLAGEPNKLLCLDARLRVRLSE